MEEPNRELIVKVLVFSQLIFFYPHQAESNSIYDSCGNSTAKAKSGCFGLPSNCISKTQNCELFVRFNKAKNENEFHFFMKGRNITYEGGYIAVGFSYNRPLKEGYVVGCYLVRPVEEIPTLQGHLREYYATSRGDQTEIHEVDRDEEGLDGSEALSPKHRYLPSLSGGSLTCEFSLKSKIHLHTKINQVYDLENESVFLFLFSGTEGASHETLGNIRTREGVSWRKVRLSETGIVTTEAVTPNKENVGNVFSTASLNSKSFGFIRSVMLVTVIIPMYL